MWNSTFPDKPRRPLKKSPFKPTNRALRKVSKSPVAITKGRIQALLRQIVMIRDKGCILRNVRCGAELGTRGVVFQADHLMSRSFSATFGDSRLVVCVCRPCHAWKSLGNNLRKAEYDTLVKTLLPKERVALWDLAEATKHKPQKMDWTLVELSLISELNTLTGRT